ncbi:proline-rich transmembrane protein 4 isoform 2-T2 [Menidia menidia]
MLLLLRTLALFWYFLLLQRQTLADEEALWGPTASNESPPEKKANTYWWAPSLPKFPPLPSFPINIPFLGRSNDESEAVALTTPAKGLTEPVEDLQDTTGSGEGSIFTESQQPTTITQGLLTSVAEIRAESLSTGTSDFPSSHIAQNDNDALVSPTSSSFIRNIPFTSSPSSSNTPEHSATHIHPPQGTAATEPSMDASPPHLSERHGVSQANGDFLEMTSSEISPQTTIPTTLKWARAPITSNPGLTSTHVLRSVTHRAPSETTFTRGSGDSTVSIGLITEEATISATPPTQRQPDMSLSENRTGIGQEQPGVISSTFEINHNLVLESITSPTQSQWARVPLAEGIPPETPSVLAYTDDWMSNMASSDMTLLPDCNKELSGICNFSYTWDATTVSDIKPTQNTTATNQSNNPFLIPAPPMLVPLYTDWTGAMAAWGLAWEAHVYGAGCGFAVMTLASALNLLCLPLRCPSGCGYFALVSMFLLAAGCTRSFSLLYDAYGHQNRIASTEASLMLYEAPFPCLTAAFGLVFLLLSMRSRMQLSYSAFQRPCFLACLVFLHFAAAFGPVTLLKLYQKKPPLCLLLSLISRGAFVGLATFLSVAYFVFYIYVRADSKHIYHLNNTSPTPAERYNRCPFAESRDWNRAAVTVCISALFSLACASLQLYAMLNAMGVVGGKEVFHPWPWWAFQFSCRLCELGVCLTLALVVAQPVYCSDQLPDAGSCWTELLASKSPILPGSYQWTLSQQEKLAIVDTVGLGETESLPLYTLMDERLVSSLNGLDLLYHSNRALAYRDLDFEFQGSEKPEDVGGRETSGGSSFTSDSTADLRPPSPINLRRSIDEALFSEALFPMSLFSPVRPICCSDMSVNNHWTLPSKCFGDPPSADPGLYRTSSCMEMASQPQPPHCQSQGAATESAPASSSICSSSSCSSPERWRGSSSSCSLYRASLGDSSLVLCPSPERRARQLLQEGGTGQVVPSDPQRPYQTLGAASQESLDLSTDADRSVQEEFISVCRQIDALSVCSETIDL